MQNSASATPTDFDSSVQENEVDRLKGVLSLAMQRIAELENIGRTFHDFNNILSSSMGYSSLAGERALMLGDEKLSRYLSNIEKAGVRSRDLVRECLAKRQHYRDSQSSVLSEIVAACEKTQSRTRIQADLPAEFVIQMNRDTALIMLSAITQAFNSDSLSCAGELHDEPHCDACGEEIRGLQFKLLVNAESAQASLLHSEFALIDAITAANGGHICKSLVQADEIVVYLKASVSQAD